MRVLAIMHSGYFLVLNLILISTQEVVGDCDENLYVNEVASTLLNLLAVNENNTKISDLKEKLHRIDKYVIDKSKYAEFLVNETMSTDLNETNFFNALNESDHFTFLVEKQSKNLYLKLQEKMTRDDILNILTEQNKGKLSKLTRRVKNSKVGDDDDINNEAVDSIVDEIIAQSPKDKHTFERSIKDDKYWDLQHELEDRKEHHRQDGRRIFKGERTTITYYPFMVSIHLMGRFWCGGSIYWHDIVLTSAACLQLLHNNRFYRENPSVLRVRVGSNNSRIGGEVLEALEVFFHPGYNPRTLRHNIAIIRLKRQLQFSYHRIPKLIEISHNSQGISPTVEVLLLGWGVSKMSQTMTYVPVFLNRKFLPVYPNIFCKEVYGDKFVTNTMFCAGTFTTGEGACNHDAGGPAIVAGKLVGIISFGPSFCGASNTPTVFTLVGAYADWIEAVNESMPSYYRGFKRTTTVEPVTFFPEMKQNFPGKTSQEETTAAGLRHRIDESDVEEVGIYLK